MVGLLWLCIMLHYVWPSQGAVSPPPLAAPVPPKCKRPRAGLAAARARGRHGGRPRKITSAVLRLVMAALADHTTQVTDVARSLGLDRTTLYLYVHGDGTPKARGQALLRGPGPAR